MSTESTFTWTSEFEPWEHAQDLGPLITQTGWELCLNKLCFSVITCIWVWGAGVWVEQGPCGPGAYLARCWDLVGAPTWSWELLPSLAVWTQEKSQTPLCLSLSCPRVLWTTSLTFSLPEQSFVWVLCMGEWFLFLMPGSHKYGLWHYQGTSGNNLHECWIKLLKM